MGAAPLAALALTPGAAFAVPGPALRLALRNTLTGGLAACAALVVIFPAGLGPGDATLGVVTHVALEILGYTLIALTLSRPAARAGYLRARLWIDRTAGAVLAGPGPRLLLPR